MAPNGPAKYHGKESFSTQEKTVFDPLVRSRNSPNPATMPWWCTPMACACFQFVISMTSVSLNGPTTVLHSKRVPTPR